MRSGSRRSAERTLSIPVIHGTGIRKTSLGRASHTPGNSTWHRLPEAPKTSRVSSRSSSRSTSCRYESCRNDAIWGASTARPRRFPRSRSSVSTEPSSIGGPARARDRQQTVLAGGSRRGHLGEMVQPARPFQLVGISLQCRIERDGHEWTTTTPVRCMTGPIRSCRDDARVSPVTGAAAPCG